MGQNNSQKMSVDQQGQVGQLINLPDLIQDTFSDDSGVHCGRPLVTIPNEIAVVFEDQHAQLWRA